jgi:hypothetical protein
MSLLDQLHFTAWSTPTTWKTISASLRSMTTTMFAPVPRRFESSRRESRINGDGQPSDVSELSTIAAARPGGGAAIPSFESQESPTSQRGRAAPFFFVDSEISDVQARNSLEMTSISRKKNRVVHERDSSDQTVRHTDRGPLPFQVAPNPGGGVRRIGVERKGGQTRQKVLHRTALASLFGSGH